MEMDFHSPTSPALLFLYQNTKLHWSDLAYSLAKCVHFSGHGKFLVVFFGFFFCGWELMDMKDLCGGKTPGFQKNHGGLCTLLLLGSNPMFCFLTLVPLGSGKTGLLEASPASLIIQGGGAFSSFAALGFIFSYHRNGSLGFFMRGSFRTHMATPDSWYVKWEMCQDPEYKL